MHGVEIENSSKDFQYISHFYFFLNYVLPVLLIIKNIDVEIKCFPLFLSSNDLYLLAAFCTLLDLFSLLH